MNIKSLIVSLMLCVISINSAYAFPMHVDTYRAKNAQEQKLVDKQKVKEGRELAQLGIELVNTVLRDDYEGYRKLIGKDKKNILTIMGGYVYDPEKDFEEENKNSFAFLKFLLDVTGIKKVELFDANNDYEAIGKRNAGSSYKSITTYWCINDEKLMVPDIRAVEAGGQVKINQFALGSSTFSKAKILNAEKNVKKILQAMCEGNYQTYKECLTTTPEYADSYPALLVELKWNKSAEAALQQIKEKQYPLSLADYAGENLLVGINYDKKSKQHECAIEVMQK